MYKSIFIILFSVIFTQELEVDGGLTVTESVNALSFVGDGSALTNLPSIGGMKPSRIYRHIQPSDGSTFILYVPENKMWRIEFWGGAIDCDQSWVAINGAIVALSDMLNWNGGKANRSNFTPITLMDGDVMSNNITDPCPFTRGGLTIYEYSISASGTSQGMDYVEP